MSQKQLILINMSFFDNVANSALKLGNWATNQVEAYTGDAAVKATEQANRDNIAFSREMYNRQRQDALTDWDKTNAYNSPSQMMKRYSEAGLNPNLVYGNGASTTAAMIRSSSPQSANQQPAINPNGGLIPVLVGLLGQFTKIMNTNAQTNNLAALEALNREKAKQSVMDQAIGSERKNLLQIESSFANNMWKAKGDKILADTKLSNANTARAKVSASEMAQHIINMQADAKLKSEMQHILNTKGKILDSEMSVYEHFMPKGSDDYVKMVVTLLFALMNRK